MIHARVLAVTELILGIGSSAIYLLVTFFVLGMQSVPRCYFREKREWNGGFSSDYV